MSSVRHRSKSSAIGLDIGSFAVRAAEISVEGGRPTLRRFGQVTLPPGAVVDGEVINADVVAEAVKRLWSAVGFTSRRVVVGVSSQRVIIRQAEILEMSESELRSSLNFEAGDLIPIPVDEAVLDFTILRSNDASVVQAGTPKMRILLAAAPKTMVAQHLAVVKKAGLEAAAVDPIALALLRSVPSEGGLHGASGAGQAEAVVSIGANLTTIAVEHSEAARFVRVIAVGGANLTSAIGTGMEVDDDTAEGMKRGAGQSESARIAVARHLAVLVDYVRGSIDFYNAQNGSMRVGKITLTGGGAQIDGVLEELRAALGPIVNLADPLGGIDTDSAALSPDQLRQSAPYLLAPVGLALWAAQPGRQITLLPQDVIIRRHHRRQAVRAAVGVLVLAVLLGLVSASGSAKVAHAKSAAHADEKRIVQLQAQVATLSAVTKIRAELASRTQGYQSAVQGNVDWVVLLQDLGVVMPPGSYLVSFSGTETPAVAKGPSSTSTATGDGQISMSVLTSGGLDAVAGWLRALAVLPSLSNVVVASEAAGSGVGAATVAFTSTATVTRAAESNRGAHIPGSAS